jgi:hypothetical protein
VHGPTALALPAIGAGPVSGLVVHRSAFEQNEWLGVVTAWLKRCTS